MYSQKNRLFTFVSKYNNQYAVLGIDVGNIPVGSIALISTKTDKVIAANPNLDDSYFAWNKGGTIHKTPLIHKFNGLVGNILPYSAAVNQVTHLPFTEATAREGVQYLVTIKLYGNSSTNTVDTIKSSVTGKASEARADLIKRLKAQLDAVILRKGMSVLTISAGADYLGVSGEIKHFSLGRGAGGIIPFKVELSTPEDLASSGTIIAYPQQGVGEGWFIQAKELLSQGNSDSSSKNSFETSPPLVLAAKQDANYGIFSRTFDGYSEANSAAKKVLPIQIILAFDEGGDPAPTT